MYLNNKYIDAIKCFCKYFSEYLQSINLLNLSINIFKRNYRVDRIFSSIIQDVNKLDWSITDIYTITFITCIWR